ncbi:MAG: S46 family peptidase, partial [Bdellovibrionota bacterium]
MANSIKTLINALVKSPLLVIFALTLAALSQQARADGMPAKGGFYQEAQLKFRPKQLQNALESVRRIQSDFDESCSSVFVSNSGYVLTNIHCLSRCNELAAQNPAKAGLKIIDASVFQGAFAGMEINNQREFVNFCNAHREERAVPYYVEPDIIGDLELIWVGRGRINMHEEKLANPALSANEIELMQNAMNDYAIFKAKPKPGEKLSCLKASSLPAPNAPVWVIGFPAWNKRENGLGASGSDKLISFGSTKESIKDD